MSSRNGFTLIEVVVAALIGAFLVIAIGGLSERLIHHRATADSNSAAMSLAERQMETLLGNPIPNPTSCPTVDSFALCAGTHTAVTVDAQGAASASGPYRVQWVVTDATNAQTSPLVTPDPTLVTVKVKRITVTVTHLKNGMVNASLVRYYKAS
jgi:prepilin-type N-terminal cleavage/methylation domain-containing protein